MSEQSARWRDLGTRVLSAVVLVAITLAALWSGPVAWDIFVFAVFGLMIYELARLCDPEISFARRVALGVVPLAYPLLAIAGIVLGDDRLIEDLPPGITGQGLFEGGIYGAVMGVAAPLIVGLVMLGRGRLLWLAYGALLCGAVLYLAYDYNQHGSRTPPATLRVGHLAGPSSGPRSRPRRPGPAPSRGGLAAPSSVPWCCLTSA